MPINRVKDGQGRTRFEFEFSRRLGGQRLRTRKLLPPSWSRAQADAFDRQESARLYAEAAGVTARRHTIDQAVARYLDERARDLKTGHGIAQELLAMAPRDEKGSRLDPYWRGRFLDELPAVCADYVRLHRDKLAPATLRNRLRYLTSACRWGWKHHGMGDADPAARVVMPAVSNERQTYIDRAQMVRLARACAHRPTRAAIRIAFYSGMRLGEIERAERNLKAGIFVLDDTKNGEPRIVPMHRKARCCVGYRLGTRFQTNYHFRKAAAVVGLDDLKFHDLRHSAASAMLAKGASLYTIGAVLGHKSGASTKRYAHHATDALRDAVGLIGKRA